MIQNRTDKPSEGAAPLVPILLLGLLLLAGVLVAADVRSPLRAAIVGLFVLVAPGWALLNLWGLARGWLGAALVVGVSSALATAVALAQLYAGLWAPNATLVTLMIVTAAAAGAALARSRTRARVRTAAGTP